jgi:hypothetical protein
MLGTVRPVPSAIVARPLRRLPRGLLYHLIA